MGLISNSGTSTEPEITLTCTNADANGAVLRFIKDAGEAGADDDISGVIEFYADDDNQDNILFAKIEGYVADASTGDECGGLKLSVAENDGTNTAGLTLVGSTTDGEVDVTIGAGTSSVTTVAGVLSLGDRNITNVGDIALDSLSADGSTITITGDTTFADGAYDFDIASHDGSNGLKLGGTLVTATAAQINALVSTGATNTFTLKQNIDLAAANLTPAADGSHFHVEGGVTMTDNNTSNSGTAAAYSQVSFEAVTLAASNSSVTTTNAATVYISAAPTAGTNQTLTNALALQVGVDDAGGDVKFYGAAAGAFAHWDESADTLILQGATAAGAGALKLTTGELTVVDGDILGRIDFQAPLESSGTDAILVAASIWAEADDTFAAGVNTCSLVFATPAAATGTATASEVLRISSLGNVTPIGNGTQDLGGSSNRWKDIYTSDMNFANDRGDWTLIEENDYITFRNNNTGRRFRMMMEDITDTDDYGPDINGNM